MINLALGGRTLADMDDTAKALALAARIGANPTEPAELNAIDSQVSDYLRTPFRSYTRSRDALKSVRPPDWHFVMDQDKEGFDCHLIRDRAEPGASIMRLAMGPRLQSEELAELHGIILAVAIDRADGQAIQAGRGLAHWPLKAEAHR